MSEKSSLRLEEIRSITEEFSATAYPGKTPEAVWEIVRQNTGFTPEEAVETHMTADEVKRELNLAYSCDTEYHPEREQEDFTSDPKHDMGFNRTGIHVLPSLGRWR